MAIGFTEGGTLTSVPGIQVGHATDPGGSTGCTVILGPFRAAAVTIGSAVGDREFGPLSPEHLVPSIDALLLTGGSAFGMSAAQGVVEWLEERGRGFETPNGVVPIVPAAVIYDLRPGAPRPTAAIARAACDAASSDPVAMGRVGAGAGARVGRAMGPERSRPGGVGGAALTIPPDGNGPGATFGALAVVNSVGAVSPWGAESEGDALPEVVRTILEGFDADDGAAGSAASPGPGVGENTTLLVVATDAPLSRVDLRRVARTASSALGRMIRPVGTPFDGDVVIALSTGGEPTELHPRTLLRFATAASEVAALAIQRGGAGASSRRSSTTGSDTTA